MPEVLIEEEIVENPIDGDLLNRQDFVDQVKDIIEIMSSQKKNSCFAINGGWGVGKSFVLEALEKQLAVIPNEDTMDRYLIVHYNCWQYDYYDEPLVAIVASILDAIEEKVHLISDESKAKFKGVLKAIGNGLLHKASIFVQDKTGINTNEIIEVIKEGNAEAATKIEENNAYDANFIFKNALISLQKEIRELSKYQTVLFVVDELDRCLPQYTIKVLERLHHVFDGIPNVQVLMSIDKSQLTHTIKQIFGEQTDVNKYLAKFIKFEINLDTGNLNALFDEKFAYYLKCFEVAQNSVSNEEDIVLFKAHIFDGMDMRSCIEIIDKCYLLHTILSEPEEKKDFSYMCVEIVLTILKHFDISNKTLQAGFNMKQLFAKEKHDNKIAGLDFLNNKLATPNGNNYLYYLSDYGSTTIRNSDIWGVILGCYRRILGYDKDYYYHESRGITIFDYAEEYNNLLQIIN